MTPILQTESAVIGFLPDALSCEVTEERNGVYELTLAYPVSAPMFSSLAAKRQTSLYNRKLICYYDMMTELDAMELLSHVKPDYKHDKHRWNVVALWSAVYNNGEGKMKIAANKDYGNIYTFKINEPCKVIDRESIEHSAYPDVKWSH